ncbi:MAG TPA: M20/M25/M40 family metallo-hydrolase [Longimicrobiales bacterium]|nr:M20/M25/M40 family metallo-hydrolase [Longimicrobiales bacterium]
MTIPRSNHLALIALLIPLLAACGGPDAPLPPAPAPASSAVADAAASITAADMARRIGVLAHDSMRGRDTPSPELEAAADYLSAQFRTMGLEPAGDDGTFLARWVFDVVAMDVDQTFIRADDAGNDARYGRDFFMLPSAQNLIEAPAFYVGAAGEIRQLPADARGAIMVFEMPGVDVDLAWQQQLVGGVQAAMMNGAAGVVAILEPEFPAGLIGQLADATAAQDAPIPVLGVTAELGRALLSAGGGDPAEIRASGTPTALGTTFQIASTRTREQHTPPNVVALLRGSDPGLRDTYVVLSAHFDHVGVGNPDETGDSIYNGADDNASGTAAILEMAEAFAALPEPPARSVVFLAVSGEEHGLLGSMAWVEDPTVDIDNVVANVNLDMVGRNAPDTVIGIGQEYSDLEDVLRDITAAHPELGLNVIRDPKPEERFFFRSDQLAFIQKGIPAVFFNTDDHEDYHEPSDEPARIDADKAARVARLAFYLAYAIATNPEAPEWTPEGWRTVEQMINQ